MTLRSLDLQSSTPTATMQAVYSKRQEQDVQVLHPDVVQRLKDWLATKEKVPKDQLLFPVSGKVPGGTDQRTTFEAVRDVCRDFLKQHPSECIVMSMKEESTAKDNSRSFSETFVESIKNDGKLWHVSRKIPQLGSVRNRIVLVDRAGNLGGLKWGGGSCKTATMHR